MLTKDQLTKIIAAAMVAVNAVKAWQKNNKTKNGPGVKIKEVGAFQKLEPNLEDDSLYGPNTVTALEFYLKSTSYADSIPHWNKKFDNIKITWTKPDLEKPKDQAVKAEPKVSTKAKTKKAGGFSAMAKSINAPKIKDLAKEDVAKIKSKYKKAVKKKVNKKIKEILSTPQFGQELPFLDNADIEQEIAKRVSSQLDAPLKNINKLLKKQDLQTKVTSEHKHIVKEDSFKKNAISLLKDIKNRLENKASLAKGNSSYRLLGLVI